MTEAMGDGGEGLYVRGRSDQRDMKQGRGSARSKSRSRGSKLKCYICNSEEHMKRDCPRGKVESRVLRGGFRGRNTVGRGSYHMTYKRDYLFDFEEYDGGNVLLGDDRGFRVRGTGKVRVQMRDESSFMLDNIRYVLKLRRNLISLGTLEKEGFTIKMQSGKIKVIKGSLVVLSGTRRANCIYNLDG
ncbi:zinc finger, CCHC-type containing protein [Tanacetum coccineum]